MKAQSYRLWGFAGVLAAMVLAASLTLGAHASFAEEEQGAAQPASASQATLAEQDEDAEVEAEEVDDEATKAAKDDEQDVAATEAESTAVAAPESVSVEAPDPTSDAALEPAAEADPNPATFTSISVDKAEYQTGDTVTITCSVSDPEGVSSVSPSFVVGDCLDENGYPALRRITVETVSPDNPLPADSYSFQVTTDDEAGEWHVVELRVYDKEGHFTTFVDKAYKDTVGDKGSIDENAIAVDLSAGKFTIEQTADSHPATFTSVKADPKTGHVGNKITITWDVADEDGIDSVEPRFVVGDYLYEGGYPKSAIGYGTTDSDENHSTLQIYSSTEVGEWHLVELSVLDKTGHRTTFADKAYAEAVAPKESDDNLISFESPVASDAVLVDLSNGDFTVEESHDEHPTTFSSISVDKKTCGIGGTVTISYDVKDEDGIDYVSPAFVVGEFVDSEGKPVAMSHMASTDSTEGSFTFKVKSDTKVGTWHVVALSVRDKVGYETTFVDKKYAEAVGEHGFYDGDAQIVDLSAADFEVLASKENRSIATDVKIGEGAPTVTTNLASVAQKLLTASELKRFEDGDDAKVWLEVATVGKDTNGFKSMRDAIANKTVVGGIDNSVVYDITLWKQVGLGAPQKITDTGDVEVELTLQVPSVLINADEKIERKFWLYRYHGDSGDADPTLDTMVDGNASTTLAFKNKKFSYFLLAHADETKQQENKEQDKDNDKKKNDGQKGAGVPKTATPKTGDATSLAYAFVALQGVALLGVGLRKRR